MGGNVTASAEVKLENGASVSGTITENAPPPVILTTTGVTVDVNPGTQPIVIEKNATLTLAPGNYGKLDAKEGTTLNLSAGHYVFEEFKIEKFGTINLDLTNGTILIDVEKKIEMKEGVEMVLQAGSVEDVLIRLEENDLKLEKNGIYLGTFLAPNADIQLEENSSLHGALYGKKVEIKKESTLTGQPAIDLITSLHTVYSLVSTSTTQPDSTR